MRLLDTRTYISLGLVSLVSTVLLAASFFGLLPDRNAAVRDGRVALAESLAASSTAILNSADPRPLDDVLRFVQKRNADLLSVGLRSREGKLVVAVGDHQRQWVPLDSPGVEIHPVHTFMDERTNATFYADVRVPDRYRIGEVNGGAKVMALALSMEQGGGGGFERNMREMADAVTAWARQEQRDGRLVIEDPQTLARLARIHAQAGISEALSARVLATRMSSWLRVTRTPGSVPR